MFDKTFFKNVIFGVPKKEAEEVVGSDNRPKRKESTRDTVESILFAFILAFLFRTFEAEAFVIPTGSMAPTLYGRHKETQCQQCNYKITVGASDEVIRGTSVLGHDARVKTAICPNCGFENPQIFDELAFNGDRILVNKYPYEFGDPDRFDVFVFKYPQDAKTNYIKRLVGLPGELIRIRGGNVYKVSGDKGEEILRKAPGKQKVLQIPVYDDLFPPRKLIEAGWPERWAGMQAGEIGQLGQWSDSDSGWVADAESRTYSISADESDLKWLRYRHFFPSPKNWFAAANGHSLKPEASLVSDFCAYNAYTGEDVMGNITTAQSVDLGKYWVRDLTINFELEITEIVSDSEIVLEICEGTSWYRCQVDPSTGNATLSEINTQLDGRVKELATASTPIDRTGRYEVTFANVDDRLCLWVNNSLVDFGDGASLEIAGATANTFPEQSDLTPIGIATSGVSAKVGKLLLERDIYYRADFSPYTPNYSGNERFEGRLEEALNAPDEWADIYLESADEYDVLDIQVGPNHYLALGDNSPRSLDGRLWKNTSAIPRKYPQSVPREYLVGKAFFIYWPHGVPFMNDGKGFAIRDNRSRDLGGQVKVIEDYPQYVAPFYPQFWRMQRIF